MFTTSAISTTPKLKTLDYLTKIHTLMSANLKQLPYETILKNLLEDFCLSHPTVFPFQKELQLAKQLLDLYQQAPKDATNRVEIVFRLASYMNQMPITTLSADSNLATLLKTFCNFFPEFIATLNEEWKSHLGVMIYGVDLAKIFQLILKYLRKNPKSTRFNSIISKHAHHIPIELKPHFLTILFQSDDEYPIEEILATLPDNEIQERLIDSANSCTAGMNSRTLAIIVYLLNSYRDLLIENNITQLIDCAMIAFNANDLHSCKANIYGLALLGNIANVAKNHIPLITKSPDSFEYLLLSLFATDWNNTYRKNVYLNGLLLYDPPPCNLVREILDCQIDNEKIELLAELYDDFPEAHLTEVFKFIRESFREYKMSDELVLNSIATIYKKNPHIYSLDLRKNNQEARIWFACKNDNSTQFISQLLSELQLDYSFLAWELHDEIIALLPYFSEEQKITLCELAWAEIMSDDPEYNSTLKKLAVLLVEMPDTLQLTIYGSIHQRVMQAATLKKFHFWCWTLGEVMKPFSDEKLRALNIALFRPQDCDRLVELMQHLIDSGYAELLSEEDNFFVDPYDILSAQVVYFTQTLHDLRYFIPELYFVRITEKLFAQFLSDNGLGRENLLQTLTINFSYLTSAQKQLLLTTLLNLIVETNGRFELKHYARPLKKHQCFQHSNADELVLRTFYLLSLHCCSDKHTSVNKNDNDNGELFDQTMVNRIFNFLRLEQPKLLQRALDYFISQVSHADYFSRYQIITQAMAAQTVVTSLKYIEHVIDDVVDESVQQILKQHFDNEHIVQIIRQYN